MSKSVSKYGQINDMPTGWTIRSNINQRIYDKWIDMFKRCYDPKYHAKAPTYKDCHVCPRWFYLSNFLYDIMNLPNFSKAYEDGFFGWSLDKDSRVIDNKEYGPDTCMFLTKEDNVRERNNRLGNPMTDPTVARKAAISRGRSVKVRFPDGSVQLYFGTAEAARQLGCDHGSVRASCEAKECSHTKTKGSLKGYTFYWADDPTCPY